MGNDLPKDYASRAAEIEVRNRDWEKAQRRRAEAEARRASQPYSPPAALRSSSSGEELGTVGKVFAVLLAPIWLPLFLVFMILKGIASNPGAAVVLIFVSLFVLHLVFSLWHALF